MPKTEEVELDPELYRNNNHSTHGQKFFVSTPVRFMVSPDEEDLVNQNIQLPRRKDVVY